MEPSHWPLHHCQTTSKKIRIANPSEKDNWESKKKSFKEKLEEIFKFGKADQRGVRIAEGMENDSGFFMIQDI